MTVRVAPACAVCADLTLRPHMLLWREGRAMYESLCAQCALEVATSANCWLIETERALECLGAPARS